MSFWRCALFLFCWGAGWNAFAESVEKVAREINTGIVFPSLHRAAESNASGLIQEEVVALHAAYGPPILDSDKHFGKVQGTLAFQNLALSLGYKATVQSQTTVLGDFIVGGAFQYEKIFFGAGMITPSDSRGFDPNVHVGVSYGELDRGFRGAIVGERLDNMDFTQIVLGAGYGIDGNVNFEVNYRTPPLSDMKRPGSSSRIGAGCTFYNERVGLGFNGGIDFDKTLAGATDKRGDLEVSGMFRIYTWLATSAVYTHNNGDFIQFQVTLAGKLPGLQ